MITKLIKVDDYWAVAENKSDVLLFSQNPKHNLPSITFSDEVAKELGIADVFGENYENELSSYLFLTDSEIKAAKNDFIAGYNQCLSNNTDKKFTLEDMRMALSEAFKASQEGYQITADEIIQPFTKEEYFCELEMEFIEEEQAGDNVWGTNIAKITKIWR